MSNQVNMKKFIASAGLVAAAGSGGEPVLHPDDQLGGNVPSRATLGGCDSEFGGRGRGGDVCSASNSVV